MNKRVALVICLGVCLLGALAWLILNRPEKEIEVNEELEKQVLESMAEEETPQDLTIDDLVDSQDYYLDGEIVSLESALPVLMKAGYKKTKEGYVGRDSGEGVASERIITASGNQVEANLSYDYGSRNSEMLQFYKNNPDDAVSVMLSSILVVIADAANNDSGRMKYTIKVGGKTAANGVMTIDQARYYQTLAFGD